MHKRLLFPLITCLLISTINPAEGQEVQAVAELLTPDTDFCENGTLNIQIRFGDSYEAPFDAWLTIYDTETGVMLEETEFITDYYPSDFDNNHTYAAEKQIDYSGTTKLRIIVSKALDRNDEYLYSPESGLIKGETLVNLYKMPGGYSAGDDQSLCGLSAELQATVGGASTATYWEATEGLSFSDPQTAATQVSANQPGTYDLTFVQENGPCRVSDEMTLTLLGQPSATLYSDSEICGSGQAEFTASLQGNGPWKLELSDDSSIDAIQDSEHLFNRAIEGPSTLSITKVTDSNNCNTLYKGEEGTVAEVVDLTPVLGPVVGESEICGSQITLHIEAHPGSGSWALLPGSAGTADFSAINDPGTLVSVDTQGSYVFRWTQNNKGCEKLADFETTFFFPLQATDFTAGPDTTLYQRDQYRLQATLPEYASGQWHLLSGSGTVLQPNNPHSEISDLSPGTTQLEWEVQRGNCPPAFAQTTIRVAGLQHPTGISPNGDGKNDYLMIPGAPTIPHNQLRVFDQQGKIVFQKTAYNNDWGGTDQEGKDLPDGYYYYLFTGENTHIKDYLIINRTLR
ncbi:gliding motility-associated C-terminal domain-containing protein [Geofilum rhodophaeum]|uniref:gliding motility-associated C-terminal domain-containing protein n=1 Tax=Geofilum rhodophaeum TaxID=1965019 RepID=UPI000B524A44|nr:gliding motility-associated C-terminal domain-containing protein [Geofilum rhodophaeum]